MIKINKEEMKRRMKNEQNYKTDKIKDRSIMPFQFCGKS